MVFQVEDDVFVVEFHPDVGVFLPQYAPEQVSRLFGQDERGGRTGFGRGGVLDQLVGVGRHERDRLRFDVDVHAVHHRAELVVGRRENRFVDARKQQVRVDGDFLFRLFVERGLRRVAQSGSAGNGQLARFPADLDFPRRLVGLDRQRLLRELFQRIDHQFDRSGDHAFLLHAVDFQRADHRGLEVRSGDLQHAVLELEQEVVENGQRVLVADHLVGGLQHVQQCGGGYDEFHMLCALMV